MSSLNSLPDFSELRSFDNPPPAVAELVIAVGHIVGFKEEKYG